MYNFLGTIMS